MLAGGGVPEDLEEDVGSPGVHGVRQGHPVREVVEFAVGADALHAALTEGVSVLVEDLPCHRGLETGAETGEREVPVDEVVLAGLSHFDQTDHDRPPVTSSAPPGRSRVGKSWRAARMMSVRTVPNPCHPFVTAWSPGAPAPAAEGADVVTYSRGKAGRR